MFKHYKQVAILFILLQSMCANAQYENLLHKSFAEKRELLVDAYANKLKVLTADSAYVMQQIGLLRECGKKNDDASLVREADIARFHYLASISNIAGDPSFKEAMEKFAEKCKDEKDYISAGRLYRVLANCLWQRFSRYEETFELGFKLMNLQPLLTEEEYPEKKYDYNFMGSAYYFFNDYKTAIFYLQKSLNYSNYVPGENNACPTLNTMGLCYRNLKMPDSSDYCFRAILKRTSAYRFNEWYGIASGNLGQNAWQRKQYEIAIPLLKTDIDTAIRYGDLGLAAGSLTPLADIYLKQGKISQAEEIAMQAKIYIQQTGQYSRYEALYPLLSALYMSKGQQQLAMNYLDSSLLVKDSLARKFSALQLLRSQQKQEITDRKAAILNIEADKKSKTIQRNFLIIFLFIAMLAAVYIFNTLGRRHRQQQELKDLRLRQQDMELSAAREQLTEFTRRISDKNKLLEELEKQMMNLQNPDSSIISQLQLSTLLTDEQWDEFRRLFDKVHSGYLARLRQKLPDLTPAETRFMVLVKLQLSNKEMAAALGVSTQSIRVTAHRLRKKLGLSEEGSLDELVNSI